MIERRDGVAGDQRRRRRRGDEQPGRPGRVAEQRKQVDLLGELVLGRADRLEQLQLVRRAPRGRGRRAALPRSAPQPVGHRLLLDLVHEHLRLGEQRQPARCDGRKLVRKTMSICSGRRPGPLEQPRADRLRREARGR